MTQLHRPVGPGDHVFLVDGSSFVFRAYFQSIRQDQKYNYRSDRLPVGAVRLFATKMLQFLRDGAAGIKPTHIAIIFDKSENSFRRELYPAYKAHRPDPPEDLVPQFPLMRATVRAFGLTPIEQDRYEADDLIATYARLAARARRRRADRLRRQGPDAAHRAGRGDVRPRLGNGDTRREERRIGVPEVVDYFGVPPEKVVDVQALAGDSTDNVPGAPGIGVKTAAQLINEYGDLDTLLARAGEIKQPKRRETLTNPETVELIRISKQLVTLVRDVELETPARRARPAEARRREAGRVPEGDGVHHDHATGRRDLRRRRQCRSSPTRPSSARPAGAAATARPPSRRLRSRRRRQKRRAGVSDRAARRSVSPRRARPRREAQAFDDRQISGRAARSPISTPGSRAPSRPASSPSTPRPRRSTRCSADLVGVSLARGAGRGLLHPDQPCAGRGPVRRRAASPDQFGRGGRRRAAEAAARSPRMC